jgi:uncharacterized RDD family membrane protein YckC
VADTATPLSAPERQRRRAVRVKTQTAEQKRMRKMVTPEGAVLNFKISTFSERMGAFIIDIIFQSLIIIGIVLVIGFIASPFGFKGWQVAGAIATVLIFFVRNFYFIFFEIGRKAATPGKRMLGLRVATRNGGQLKANAIIARNFLRELEFWLPLSALFGLGGTGVSGWISLLIFAWCMIFVFFPLFNKDKMRVGDLVAGTIVIHSPKVQLLKDIASATPHAVKQSGIIFTPAQLDIYGIHELHVLEDVLRQSTPDIKRNVANRIATKIGWVPEPGQTDILFLEAFYGGLRKHLEQGMLFGKKKVDKYDQGKR